MKQALISCAPKQLAGLNGASRGKANTFFLLLGLRVAAASVGGETPLPVERVITLARISAHLQAHACVPSQQARSFVSQSRAAQPLEAK
jgi:hypothetical protein